jgi:hypothetical protein
MRRLLRLITTLEGKVNQLKDSWLSSSGKRLFIQTRDGFHVWNTEEGKIIYCKTYLLRIIYFLQMMKINLHSLQTRVLKLEM